MTRIDEDLVKELASMRYDDAPVVSCYLDVDGSRYVRPHDYELHLDEMVRRTREREHKAGHHTVCDDLQRIDEHVKAGIDRSHTRGLAMFACSPHDLWRVVELPVPVRNRLVVNASPQVRQLEGIIDEYERFAVLLADRQRARMFVFELGELVDKTERLDALPRHEDDGGDLDRDSVRSHVDAAAHHHLKRAARAAFEVFQDQGFDHLILGAPDPIVADLERELHPYLRERIAARVSVAVGAREDEIRRAALEVESQVERAKEAAAVEKLRDAVGAGNGGAAGLDPVLAVLVERRVDTLLVSDGFEAPGWRCPACGYVATKGRRCPVCSSDMNAVEDVVEEAVEEALAQSCRVEVCHENADLDVLGRIGALLRF
jgi:peptide chain release factor subunit 1